MVIWRMISTKRMIRTTIIEKADTLIYETALFAKNAAVQLRNKLQRMKRCHKIINHAIKLLASFTLVKDFNQHHPISIMYPPTKARNMERIHEIRDLSVWDKICTLSTSKHPSIRLMDTFLVTINHSWDSIVLTTSRISIHCPSSTWVKIPFNICITPHLPYSQTKQQPYLNIITNSRTWLKVCLATGVLPLPQHLRLTISTLACRTPISTHNCTIRRELQMHLPMLVLKIAFWIPHRHCFLLVTMLSLDSISKRTIKVRRQLEQISLIKVSNTSY